MSDSDPYSHLRRDPALGPLVDQHGHLELEPHPDPFRRLVRTIISQQLSTASASAIRGRVFDRHEITPAGLLAADEDDLRDAGLSRQKIDYVRSVAEAFAEREFDTEAFAGMTDEEVIDELTSIRGVGVWTGKIFCMFALAREDVFPVEDLGIRKGMWTLYDDDLSRSEMAEVAENWRPYRSYASMYLWRAVDDE